MAPILDTNDIKFFTFFGFLVAIFMKMFEQIDLPDQMERGFLNSLFFDHIPFGSISTLFISLIVLFCLSIIIGKFHKKHEKRKTLLVHISNRISQLCSPAFFIIIGLGLGTLLFGFTSENSIYYKYTITLITLAGMFLTISCMSNWLVQGFDLAHKRVSPQIAIVVAIIFILATLLTSLLDNSPIKAEVSIPISSYSKLKEKADKLDITVEGYIAILVNSDLKSN